MKYYPINRKTGEALPPVDADLDPAETELAGEPVYFKPGRFETTEAPPAPQAGKAIVRENGQWTYVDDKRGETWYKLNGDPVVIKELGEEKVLQDVQPTEPPEVPTVDKIMNEYLRRLNLLLGTTSDLHAVLVIGRGNREATRLLKKGKGTWTPEEAARAAELEAIEAQIEILDATRETLIANPVLNYKDDSHWTGGV